MIRASQEHHKRLSQKQEIEDALELLSQEDKSHSFSSLEASTQLVLRKLARDIYY